MSNEWSNDATTSLTLPTGATNPDQRIVLDGATDTILIYDNTGALIASIAANAGTDGFGNSYPAGISSTSGIISQSIILLYNGTPALNNMVLSLTADGGTDSFGNIYQAGFTIYDGTSGTPVRNIDISGLDTIGASTSSQFVIDPINGKIQFYDNTGLLTGQIISSNGAIIFYTSTTTTVTYNANTTFVVPANITSLKVEAWGGGGGGQYGSGAGGGGGEYAQEPALAVTPGESLTLTMSVGGAGGTSSSPHGVNAISTTVKRGTTTLVQAHGGQGSSSATTLGGTGSTNTIHFNGGGSHANTTGLSQGGAGGGESGWSGGPGNNGSSNTGSTGGAGGSGTAGYNGGNGGNGTGTTGTAGQNAPTSDTAGGGGAGGSGSVSGSNGGKGGRGQVRITYTNTATIEVSIAAVAGTDQFGNSYPKGIQVGVPGSTRFFIDPTGPTMTSYNSSSQITSQWSPATGSATYLDNTNLRFLGVSVGNASTAGSGILAGNISSAGSLPTTAQQNAAGFMVMAGDNSGFNQAVLNTGATGTSEPAFLEIDSGTFPAGGAMTPGVSPQFVIASGLAASGPTFCVTDGAWVYGGGGGYVGWQTPTYNANWAGSTTYTGTACQSLRFRIDAEDNLWLEGAFKCTGAAGASVFALPSGSFDTAKTHFFPVLEHTAAATFLTGGGNVSTAGNFNINLGANFTRNNGDEFYVNAKVPMGHIT